MADVEQFKDDLENNADGLIGGSRGDFMEALEVKFGVLKSLSEGFSLEA